ncbi:MAG TPA: tetratricopeptide repeat protein [Candidatus Krumholzibacteriaceae bacterium]|nr:tetratricopeptide repeat protein [Candidatus Krumholzibacteriaceae bacterium]
MTKRFKIIRAVLAAIFLLIILPQLNLRGDQEESEDILRQAREAAADDRHGEAIRLYFKASRLDRSLRGELGKEIGLQYTWSDKPDSAIIWFKRYLETHPEDIEGMLGLARALSWADKNSEALKWYRRITREYPGVLDARVGEARVVSWLDRNAQAEDLYREIIEKHPGNLEAALGLARVLNWQGKHRGARSMYNDILEKHPDSEEALKGKAQALRWLGLGSRARKLLAGIEGDSEAKEILSSIEHDRAPRLKFDYGTSYDSDGLEIHKGEAAGLYNIYGETTVGLGVARHSMRQEGMQHVTRIDLAGRLSSRFNENWAVHLNLLPVFHRAGSDDFTALTWDGWLTWNPADRFRADLSAGRAVIATPLSVQREIIFSGSGIGLDYKITQSLKALTAYDYRSYSDGNRRNLVKAAFNWRIISSPFIVEVQPGYTFFSFKEYKANGYYNPAGYHNVGVQVGIGGDFSESVYYRVEGRLSREKEKGEDFFSVGSFRSSVEWRAGESLELGGEFFASNSRVAGEAGYSRTLTRVFLRIIF